MHIRCAICFVTSAARPRFPVIRRAVSCGTEADNWAIWGTCMHARRQRGAGFVPHVVSCVTEPPAVLQFLVEVRTASMRYQAKQSPPSLHLTMCSSARRWRVTGSCPTLWLVWTGRASVRVTNSHSRRMLSAGRERVLLTQLP